MSDMEPPDAGASPEVAGASPEVERRLSFDGVAEIYDRVRPSYPPEAFADLFEFWRAGSATAPVPSGAAGQPPDPFEGAGAGMDVLEIGPGTGKATRALLAAGARVTAVEYGPRLAEYLREQLGASPRLEVITGAFEEVVLPVSGFDLVFAATAFHWIDPAVRIDKSLEVLRPSGVVATLSTVQVRSEADRGFFDRTSAIYRKYQNHEVADDELRLPEDVVPTEFADFREHPRLVAAELRRYRWDQDYTTASYADLLRSYSNMQVMEAGAREALIDELCELIDDEFGGLVVRALVIALAIARRATV